MAIYFDITAIATSLSLDAQGRAGGSFTVTNAGEAPIGGEVVVLPEPGAEIGWFSVGDPARSFPPQHTEQVGVDIAVPLGVAPGRYGFRLRVLLAGGVPEEQYDDGPVVSFDVPAAEEPIAVVEPPQRPFPWWMVAIIGGVAAIIVIAAVLFVVLSPGDRGRLVFKSAGGGNGSDVCALDVADDTFVFGVIDGCQDDSARSVVLENVNPGVNVGVYDSQVCSPAAHWSEIEVAERQESVVVGSFESNVASPPVAVTYHPTLNAGVTDTFGSSVFEDMVAIEDVGQLRARVQEAIDAGDEVVAIETDLDDLAIDRSLIDLITANDLEIVWPGDGEDDDGVDGRVSCVRVNTSS